mgnify:CR=1 FL=1|tara:strand:- start:97 stop:618 length:522 start_codon:yes stop_codon:yes gene_type:complete
MLPLIGLSATKRQPDHPLLFGKASLVIGVLGKSPSVVGEAAISTGDELDAALRKASVALDAKPAYFLIALVANVHAQYFQALTLHYSNAELRLYDATFRSDTLDIITHKPLFTEFDMRYTWSGIKGIGRMWFEIEINHQHEEGHAIQSRSGYSVRVGLRAFGQTLLATGDKLE